MPKPYLDIFGDWYYTKTQGSNKNRSLGIDTVTNFYEKYGVLAEKQTAAIEKFSAIFGSDYLFGDKNGVFGSDGKGVDVCRPADVAEIIPYLEMRLKTIETEKNIIPGTGASVYKNRLDRIKKNIERYVMLMKSSNSQKMKVCEQVKGIEEPMTDQDMLQYLAKVLYYGIYPEKAEPNIKKCVSDFRQLPMKEALNELLVELKKRDADKLLSFLTMASTAVASLPGRAADMTSIRIHLTEIFDKLQPGLGTSSFSSEEPLKQQLETAVKATTAESVATQAGNVNIPDSLIDEINKILQSGKTYPPEIIVLLKLLKDRKMDDFITELSKLYSSYDETIEKLKVETKKIIDALSVGQDVTTNEAESHKEMQLENGNGEDIIKTKTRIIFTRLRRLLGMHKPGTINSVRVDDEVNWTDNLLRMAYKYVISPEKLASWVKIFEEIEKTGYVPIVEQTKEINDSTEKMDAELKKLRAEIEGLFEKIRQISAKDPNDVKLKEAIDNLVRSIKEKGEKMSIIDLITIVETLTQKTQSDEIVAEINKFLEPLKGTHNLKELLEAIKGFKKVCQQKGEIPSIKNSELDKQINTLKEGVEKNIGNLNRAVLNDAKEQYLNTITALIKHAHTHISFVDLIADLYTDDKKEQENINSDMILQMGVPDSITADDIINEILDRLVYEDAFKFTDVHLNGIDDDKLKSLLIEMAKIIIFMSMNGEGVLHLYENKEPYNPEIIIDTLNGLLQKGNTPKKMMFAREPALLIDSDNAMILFHPIQYDNSQIKKKEYIMDTFNVKKYSHFDVEAKEIEIGENPYTKTIHEFSVWFSHLSNPPLYSRRDIINLFIALIKKFRKSGEGAESEANLSNEKTSSSVLEVEEESEKNKEDINLNSLTEEINTPDEDITLNEVGEADAEEEPSLAPVLPDVELMQENQLIPEKNDEVVTEINKGAHLNPFAEPVKELEKSVTMANAYSALNESDEVEKQEEADENRIKKRRAEMEANQRGFTPRKGRYISKEFTAPSSEKVVDVPESLENRMKKRRAEMEANERGFTPRKSRRASKEFIIPSPEQLPNIPASVGEPPEHPVTAQRRKNASMRLKKIFNSNIPVNNSMVIGNATAKVAPREDIYGAQGEKRAFEPVKTRGKGFKLTKKNKNNRK